MAKNTTSKLIFVCKQALHYASLAYLKKPDSKMPKQSLALRFLATCATQ
ncbi:MAG: hypothetical protein IJU79_02520 [Desulfovibrionaceae bacterium]|nr:hypothetical protein [Desulfovibrionaceae bacterium]